MPHPLNHHWPRGALLPTQRRCSELCALFARPSVHLCPAAAWAPRSRVSAVGVACGRPSTPQWSPSPSSLAHQRTLPLPGLLEGSGRACGSDRHVVEVTKCHCFHWSSGHVFIDWPLHLYSLTGHELPDDMFVPRALQRHPATAGGPAPVPLPEGHVTQACPPGPTRGFTGGQHERGLLCHLTPPMASVAHTTNQRPDQKSAPRRRDCGANSSFSAQIKIRVAEEGDLTEGRDDRRTEPVEIQ